ncbi:MAG: sialidase family protein [Spirochaetota bacterium]
MAKLEKSLELRLERLSKALVDQEKARVIVAPERPLSGYWFGGGNMVEAPDGSLWLSGRYRNAGDSRTGLDLGDRGRELALFRSEDRGVTWNKVLGLDKKQLSPDGLEVLSIEGSALRITGRGTSLYVSSEKRRPYPQEVASYLKPGTGVWSIELLSAASPEALADAQVSTVLWSDDPERLHIKDPFLYATRCGERFLFFCHHPYLWSSSNSGYAPLEGGLPGEPDYSFLERGRTWDVAISRTTCILDVPRVGAFAGAQACSLVFYDGGECLRSHEEHAEAKRRPRGHSCEELGGVGYFSGTVEGPTEGAGFGNVERLSALFPAFVSPWGTGSSRYVTVLACEEGLYASWQQSQPDRSQALVLNMLPMDEVRRMLA